MKSPTFSYLQNQVCSGPNDALFMLLIFILSKNLHATPLQLAVIACLKPITALFSFYISGVLHDKPHRIRPYLAVNMLLGILPCFFFPFIDNVWFYIASFAIYKITDRAQDPAWSEYLKSHLEFSSLSSVVSKGTSITYFINMCLPYMLSSWLKGDSWKLLFVLFSLLQLANTLSIFFLKSGNVKKSLETPTTCVSQKIMDPWKKGWLLLKGNPSFFHYLSLYFLGGAGIVAMYSTLPIYFDKHLGLSFEELTLAFSFCKGFSFLMSSPIWAKYMSHISLYRLNAYTNLLTCFFIGGLLAAGMGLEWLYAGYLCYGAMQGGSELSLSLSGPIFAKEKDSTAYSSLNLLLIGVRGCICPFLGFLILTYAGVIPVFLTTLSLCSIGFVYGLWLDAKYSNKGCNEASVTA